MVIRFKENRLQNFYSFKNAPCLSEEFLYSYLIHDYFNSIIPTKSSCSQPNIYEFKLNLHLHKTICDNNSMVIIMLLQANT